MSATGHPPALLVTRTVKVSPGDSLRTTRLGGAPTDTRSPLQPPPSLATTSLSLTLFRRTATATYALPDVRQESQDGTDSPLMWLVQGLSRPRMVTSSRSSFPSHARRKLCLRQRRDRLLQRRQAAGIEKGLRCHLHDDRSREAESQ